MCSAQAHVRFTPNSDIKCDVWGCPFGPKANIRSYSITSLLRVEFPDPATNGLVEAVRDGNAVVAFKNFNDALDPLFDSVVTLLAPHCRNCLVQMLDPFLFPSLLHAGPLLLPSTMIEDHTLWKFPHNLRRTIASIRAREFWPRGASSFDAKDNTRRKKEIKTSTIFDSFLL